MLIELQQDSELFANLSEEQMGLGDYIKYNVNELTKWYSTLVLMGVG